MLRIDVIDDLQTKHYIDLGPRLPNEVHSF
jgi:hypothetical protein